MPPRWRAEPDRWIHVDRHPMRTLEAVVLSVLVAFLLGVACGYWLHWCSC